MSTAPDWVQALRPSAPQGSDLLAQERDRSNLNVSALSAFLFTQKKIDKEAKILALLQNDEVFDKSLNYFDGRVERFKTALAREKQLRRLAVEHRWDDEAYNMAQKLVSEPGPYGLHSSMFLTTLRDQSTPEQMELFTKRAEAYEIIGCYAQTELGHGSNVRGLETTSTWNPTRKTFTIHSPSLTACKWWIGSLGRTANHAVVMAQLMIDGKNYGPHPFIVQVRDMSTHEPLPGRYVGDIGPKVGYNTMDNGFLLFNNVEIPHVNMFAKYSRVDPKTNKYVKPISAALAYGTMVWVRAHIVLDAGKTLARGVTIATRYTSIRRQFQDRDTPPNMIGKDETQVLDYTMVQYRILPLLASTFALHCTGKAMMKLYDQQQEAMARQAQSGSSNKGRAPETGGNVPSGTDLLADLHATSCGLKSLGSTMAGEGLEVCRRALGGHGYSNFSGIGTYHADYLPTLTWEGDNYMLTQQVARYLLKSARAVQQGAKPSNDTTEILAFYLSKKDNPPTFDILNSDKDLVLAFAWRAAHLTFDASKHRDDEKEKWNALLVDFWRLSNAHSQYLIVKNFYEELQSPAAKQLDQATQSVLKSLFRLFALYTLENAGQEFFASRALSAKVLGQVRNKSVLEAMEAVRPHAVRLADSWNFSDWQMDSSLGRADGKVYEDLFHRASQMNPLNGLTVDPYVNSSTIIKKDETAKYRAAAKGSFAARSKL